MLRRYRRLRPNLPKEKGEVKGRLLTADQVAEVAGLLASVEALFEIAVMELGNHTLADVQGYQERFANSLGANITPEHSEAIRAWVIEAQAAIMSLKPPLFVQTLLTYEVLKTAFEHATNYFSQRRPGELGRYAWIVDGKEPLADKTPWEKWWSDLLMPVMQAKSIVEPFGRVDGFDYRHLERAFGMEKPDYLLPHLRPEERDKPGINIRLIFGENVRFSTKPEEGLELVDIITNGVRRALLGHLEPAGWTAIRSLMIHRKDQYISMYRLNEEVPILPYRRVLIAFKSGGKSMMAVHHRP